MKKVLDCNIYEEVIYYERNPLYVGNTTTVLSLMFKYRFAMDTLNGANVELGIRLPTNELVTKIIPIVDETRPLEVPLPDVLKCPGELTIELTLNKDNQRLTHPTIMTFGVKNRLSELPDIKPSTPIDIDGLIDRIVKKTDESITSIIGTKDVIQSEANVIVDDSKKVIIATSTSELAKLTNKAKDIHDNLNTSVINIHKGLDSKKEEINTSITNKGVEIKKEIEDFIRANDVVISPDIQKLVSDISYAENILTVTRVDGTVQTFKIEATLGIAIVNRFKVDTLKCAKSEPIVLDPDSESYDKTTWVELETLVSAQNMNKIEDALSILYNRVADLEYTPVAITNISLSVYVVENGDAARNVILQWTLNKNNIKSQSIDDRVIDINSRNYVIGNVFSNKSIKYSVTDKRNHTVTTMKSIKFLSGVYYGTAPKTDNIDSQFIIALNKELTDNRTLNFTVNSIDDKHIYYALPTRLGIPTFIVGGFEGGFSHVCNMMFHNKFGFTEAYGVYRSNRCNLGQTNVKVI